MNCPKCGGPMWDNRENKKNPKGPDFTCKQVNGECKFQLEAPGSTTFVPSEYKTGVWEPKEGGFGKYAQRPTPKAVTPTEAHPMVKNPDGDGFVKGTDWDKVGAQKNRSNLASAVLHGKDLDWKMLMELEAWVLTGKTPAELTGGIDINDVPF